MLSILPNSPILCILPLWLPRRTAAAAGHEGDALSSLLSAVLAALQPECGALIHASLATQGTLRIFDFLGNAVLDEIQNVLAAELPGTVRLDGGFTQSVLGGPQGGKTCNGKWSTCTLTPRVHYWIQMACLFRTTRKG